MRLLKREMNHDPAPEGPLKGPVQGPKFRAQAARLAIRVGGSPRSLESTHKSRESTLGSGVEAGGGMSWIGRACAPHSGAATRTLSQEKGRAQAGEIPSEPAVARR